MPPNQTPNEYHLIDRTSGRYCGAFASLTAARDHARHLGLTAWDISRSDELVERREQGDPEPEGDAP